MNYNHHMNWIGTSCKVQDRLVLVPPPTIPAGRRPSLESIAAPKKNDVIFTGGKIRNHIGNQRFLELIRASADDYGSGTDETKRKAVNEIINKIQASGGRFLRPTSSRTNYDVATNWEPLPPDLLRKRIMQAFRNQRRINASSQQREKNTDDAVSGTYFISGRPLPADVIFGRSRGNNPGTELLHHLVKENFEKYESLARGVKMILVERIIMQTIIGHGGRFLQPSTVEPGSWFEVTHEAARERISKYFRNHRRPSTKKIK